MLFVVDLLILLSQQTSHSRRQLGSFGLNKGLLVGQVILRVEQFHLELSGFNSRSFFFRAQGFVFGQI